MLNSSFEPERATITEFEWLIDTLKNRCVNSEKAIVDTILSAWKLIKNRGYDISLLEITRALTKNAADTTRFGNKKIDFVKTSGLWTARYKQKSR